MWRGKSDSEIDEPFAREGQEVFKFFPREQAVKDGMVLVDLRLQFIDKSRTSISGISHVY